MTQREVSENAVLKYTSMCQRVIFITAGTESLTIRLDVICAIYIILQ